MDSADNAGKIEGQPCLFWQGDALFEGGVSKGTAGEWDRIQDEQSKAKESTEHWNGQEAENGNKSTRQGCG